MLFKAPAERILIADSVAVYKEELHHHPAGNLPYPVSFSQVGVANSGMSVAASELAVIKSLRATATMTARFAEAMVSDPTHFGADPWHAVIEAAKERNTTHNCKGVPKQKRGWQYKIVRDSRSDLYTAAAWAAIHAIESPKATQETVTWAAMAKGFSPLCIDQCIAKLGEEKGRLALKNALAAGDSDNPDRIKTVCSYFAEAEAWHPPIKDEISENTLFGSVCYTSGAVLSQCRIDAAKHRDEYITGLLNAQ